MKPDKFTPTVEPLTAIESTICNAIGCDGSEPFFVVDIDDILMKHKSWQLNMPRVKPYYSVRANSTKIVLETLAGLGVGFHCINKAEIEIVLATDASPKMIINGTPLKTNMALRHSWSKGVDLVTVDSEHDLRRIAASNNDARILLKLIVDGTDEIGCKLGADPDKCRYLLHCARELQLKVVGVAFHIASGYKEPTYYSAAIGEAAQIFSMAAEYGFELNILDIGGGFPSTADGVFEDMCAIINRSLDIYFPQNDDSSLTIVAEPGRFFVATAFTLVTRIADKTVTEENSAIYSLDDEVFGSFGCTVFQQSISDPVAVINSNHGEVKQTRDVFHAVTLRSNDSYDDTCCLKEGLLFPEMECGEWIVFPDMGAYTISPTSWLNDHRQTELRYCFSEISLNKLRGVFNWPRIAKLLDIEDNTDYTSIVDRLTGSTEQERLTGQLSRLVHVN